MHIFILFMREYTYKYGPTFSYGDDGRGYQKNLKKKSAKLQYFFFKDHSERTNMQTCTCTTILCVCKSVIQYVVRMI